MQEVLYMSISALQVQRYDDSQIAKTIITLDFLRAMPVKIAVENGKICNKTTMGETVEKINEVWIVDETDSFRLDSAKKTERRFRCTMPDMRAVLQRTTGLGFVYG